MDSDKKEVRQVVERKREWTHPDDGKCERRNKPIYTDPGSLPGPCGRGWPYSGGCGQETWNSKGIVLRTKNDKKVVHREADRGY